jgi:hypothetical protein
MVAENLPKAARQSRRSLLKAAGIVVGAVSASVPDKASAQYWCFWCGGGDGNNNQCFLKGTRLRTATGYRRIETLAAGDLLPTRFKGNAPIRRIERFTVHRDASGAWPGNGRLVRIGRDAFADNVPTADLHVTDAHAVLLDGVLVRIGSLVNGETIAYDDAPGRTSLEFFHVEFDSHDIVDAEGALCESLQGDGMEACVPILEFTGGRSELGSRLRSALAPLIDRRRPLDVIRDKMEERAAP